MQVFHLIAILQLIAIIVLSPKVYSTGPDTQCQAQQALRGVWHARLTLARVGIQLPPPCSSGPWTRVASLNMSDPLEQCPPSWRLYSANGVRACGRQVTTSTTGGCYSQNYTIQKSLPYQRVCGQIIGYQIRSTESDVFGDLLLSINEPYVDGVSVSGVECHADTYGHLQLVFQKQLLHLPQIMSILPVHVF